MTDYILKCPKCDTEMGAIERVKTVDSCGNEAEFITFICPKCREERKELLNTSDLDSVKVDYRRCLYKQSLKILAEHCDESSKRCEISKSQGKGAFGALKDPDFKRESELAQALMHHLAREYLLLNGKEDKSGCCGVKCIDCDSLRYNFEEKHWYCQYECECK